MLSAVDGGEERGREERKDRTFPSQLARPALSALLLLWCNHLDDLKATSRPERREVLSSLLNLDGAARAGSEKLGQGRVDRRDGRRGHVGDLQRRRSKIRCEEREGCEVLGMKLSAERDVRVSFNLECGQGRGRGVRAIRAS